MAINEILTNTSPMVHTEIACTQDSPNVSIPTLPPIIDFCYCAYECQYQELKLVNPGGEKYENDKSSFINEVVDLGGTIVYKLYKGSELKATIVDNTYGTYYGLGAVPNSSTTDQSLKSGFICEWEKVYTAFGVGEYQIKTTVTNYTRDLVFTSPFYNVALYTVNRANRTIVLKATQNGYIQGGMDYTGINWVFEYRISGKLFEETPEFINTTYLSTSREEQQRQAQTIRVYKLHLIMISSNISAMLIDDNVMANKLTVMDYNIWNHGLSYVEKNLTVNGFDTLETFLRSQKANLVIDMKPSRQNIVKRNFK